jgi:hypothetical protein
MIDKRVRQLYLTKISRLELRKRKLMQSFQQLEKLIELAKLELQNFDQLSLPISDQ